MTYQQVVFKRGAFWYIWFIPANKNATEHQFQIDELAAADKSLKRALKLARKAMPGPVAFTYLLRESNGLPDTK